jgi:hypothetical protein
VAFHYNHFGTPASAMPPDSDAEPLEGFNIRFGFALYVI